jgi:hypothetical protein
MNIGKLAPWLLIAATFALMLGTPQVLAAPGSISFTAPDFAWQYSNVTGVSYIKGNCSFNTMSTVGTGGLFDFSGFYWDTGAVTFGRFGFGCDTFGDVMNVTGMTATSVTMLITGTTQARIWAPDRTGGISSVTGATYVYDSVNRIVELTTDAPGTVVITWYAPLVNPNNASTGVSEAARLLATFLPLLMLFMVMRNPKDYKLIIGIGVTILVIMALAGVIYGMGY